MKEWINGFRERHAVMMFSTFEPVCAMAVAMPCAWMIPNLLYSSESLVQKTSVYIWRGPSKNSITVRSYKLWSNTEFSLSPWLFEFQRGMCIHLQTFAIFTNTWELQGFPWNSNKVVPGGGATVASFNVSKALLTSFPKVTASSLLWKFKP